MTSSIRTLALLAPFALWCAPALSSPQAATPEGVSGAFGGTLEEEETEAQPPGEILMFRLRTGMIQWGDIVDHTPDVLVFRRLDTGGVVSMPWGFLDTAQETDLRIKFGYIEVGGDEIMVTADMLVTLEGQEVVGVILGRTDDAIQIKSGGLIIPVPKNRIANHVTGLQVPALEVYTKDELYASELMKIDPADPQGQVDIAEFCERILDFPRAMEHYQLAQGLDPEFKPKELAVILERVAIKVENQEQIEALADIDHLLRRKKYEQALQALVLFDSNYPGSPLESDREKLERRVLKARDDRLRKEVPRRWFAWMGKFAAKAAREMTFEQTLSYLEESFSEEIVAKVTEEMRNIWPEIEEDHVRQLFIERKRGRWKPASYGLGTWLLGEDDALKGMEAQAATEKEATSPRDKQRQQHEQQIQKFLRSQSMAKRNSRSEDDEQEVEKEWKILSSSARRNWIIAHYAENSGELDLRPKPELRNCSECGGTGAREVIYTGGAREGATSGLSLVTCPTCHGIGRVRRIRYR